MVKRKVGATAAETDDGVEPAASGWKSRKISIAGGCLSSRRSTDSLGRVKVRITLSPCCVAARSVTAVGIGALRSTGSPGAPQPMRRATAKMEIRKWKIAVRDFRVGDQRGSGASFRISIFDFLKNVTAEVLVLHDIR